MAKKSTFKRLTKLEKGLPKSGRTFLTSAGYKGYGGVLAGWFKGDIGHTQDYVLVMVNENEGGYDVIYNKDGQVVIENHTTLYQTFLAHKAARFQ
jgi:hypothetical protein